MDPNFKIFWKLSFVCISSYWISYVYGSSSTTTFAPYIPPTERSDLENICAKNDHFTDPKFTCCGTQRYEAPAIYSVSTGSDCYNDLESKKLIQASWDVFKCLMDKELNGKEVNIKNVGEILMAPMPSAVKEKIKVYLTAFEEKGYSPYKKTKALDKYTAYATSWSAYYTAENWACVDSGSGKQKVDEDDEENSGACYTWMEQNNRRGDCCAKVPIPFQLYPDPIVDRYLKIRQYTAANLMKIAAPDFDSVNASSVMDSKNVEKCVRTATLIQQNRLNLDDLKMKIQSQTPPNYEEITELYIPKFISNKIRIDIKTFTTDSEKIAEDFYFTLLDPIISNETDVYRHLYFRDWKKLKFDANATRYLFWNCRAYHFINIRYKDFPMDDMCK